MTAAHIERQTFTADERRITLIGVMIVFLLSALDQTIVSTAMPRIVAQLQGLNYYAWVTTAYMLSSTVMVPIYGKLNDIHGRKAVLISGVCLFLFGSMLCGLAGEFGSLPLLGGGMTQLIVFRAVQGLGGGALFTSAFAIIADLFPPRERAKFGGLFGSVFGLASILGPVVGGFFTDLGTIHVGGAAVAGWRLIFYVNIPVGLLALFMVVAKMPKLLHRAPGRIDFVGAGLIVTTFVPLLLALSWGGRDYAWNSPVELALFAVSLAGLAAFVWTESVVENPILSLALFKNKVFANANLASFVSSMAFMGNLTFLPLYMQLGQGVPATTSGLSMLPMMVGMVASSGVSGQVVNRTGKYKPVMIGGSCLVVLGLFLLSRLTPHTTTLDLGWRVLILGIGLGPSMSLFNLAVQNAVDRSQIGVASSSSQFFRQIGGTVGVALFGAVLTHNLAMGASALGKTTGSPDRPAHALSLSDLQRMALGASVDGMAPPATHASAPVHVDPAVRSVVVTAVTGVFAIGVGVSALALLLVLRVPALPLRAHPAGEPPKPPEVQAAEAEFGA